MARRKSDDPKEQLNVRIPSSLRKEIEEKLSDPVRNKTKYGSVSELITSLLYSWARADKPLSRL